MLRYMCPNERSARNIKDKAKSKQRLMMIDYLSKYVELKPLNSTTAQSVMQSIYATQVIPEDLVSNGGSPFNSNSMMNFF
ncbi:hypothetical protein TNIN_109841 [Trichonephila inaurata madagascariensis]|uniref:Uncharacterized protein n=1 Tax=Trichonephila inaurata madagascariensis TaxID=2747483 RepID=A0A8X6WTL2_9ARAC|nr:hypothetical protein TNIN_109841 [Trichonephila inaurata madagascariensis]